MAWDDERYQRVRRKCKDDLENRYKTPSDYMLEYKIMIEKQEQV